MKKQVSKIENPSYNGKKTEKLLENNKAGSGQIPENMVTLDGLGKKYDSFAETQKGVDRLEEEANKAREEISKMRNSLNLPPQEDAIALDESIEDLKGRLGQMPEEIESLESEYLSVPENAETQGTGPGKEEKFQEEFEEEMGKELEKMKREFIEQFTENAVEYFSEEFKSYFEDSENGDKAEELLAFKIKHSIAEGTKEWVKDKDAASGKIEVSAGLSLAHFDTKDGKKQYVTGINVHLLENGQEKSSETSNNSEEGELISQNEEKALKRAKRAGILQEEEKDSETND